MWEWDPGTAGLSSTRQWGLMKDQNRKGRGQKLELSWGQGKPSTVKLSTKDHL
jgi:hypothetical protein